jgi:hypothetical protein
MIETSNLVGWHKPSAKRGRGEARQRSATRSSTRRTGSCCSPGLRLRTRRPAATWGGGSTCEALASNAGGTGVARTATACAVYDPAANERPSAPTLSRMGWFPVAAVSEPRAPGVGLLSSAIDAARRLGGERSGSHRDPQRMRGTRTARLLPWYFPRYFTGSTHKKRSDKCRHLRAAPH